MFTLGGSPPFHSPAAAKAWNTLAYPEKAADGLDELGHRDRLRQISLATALADALFIALHRKCRHRDHGDGLELGVFLEPFGHFETGDLRQLYVHQDQIGTALAGEIEHIEAVARADGAVAVGLQQVVEELHVELVVLDDHYCLRHLSPSGKSAHEPRCAAGRAPRLRTSSADPLRKRKQGAESLDCLIWGAVGKAPIGTTRRDQGLTAANMAGPGRALVHASPTGIVVARRSHCQIIWKQPKENRSLGGTTQKTGC